MMYHIPSKGISGTHEGAPNPAHRRLLVGASIAAVLSRRAVMATDFQLDLRPVAVGSKNDLDLGGRAVTSGFEAVSLCRT